MSGDKSWGYIKLHRKWRDSDISKMSHAKEWCLFTHILTRARVSEITHGVGKKQITIRPGQMLMSQRDEAEKLGISRRTLVKCLNYLSDNKMITMDTSQNGTLITVVNWKKYQCMGAESMPPKNKVGAESSPQVGAESSPPRTTHGTTKYNEENVLGDTPYIPQGGLEPDGCDEGDLPDDFWD